MSSSTGSTAALVRFALKEKAALIARDQSGGWGVM